MNEMTDAEILAFEYAVLTEPEKWMPVLFEAALLWAIEGVLLQVVNQNEHPN